MKHPPLSLPLAPGATLGLATNIPSIAVPSAFQRIAVEHSVCFGRLYHLDGDAMAAEATWLPIPMNEPAPPGTCAL